MKRFSVFLMCLCIAFLSSCGDKREQVEKTEEIRALWISVYDMAQFKGVSEGGFRGKAENMFRDIRERGFEHVFIQVRPSSDALYNSELFPWSKYISGEQGKSPGYDPFAIFLAVAHFHNLKVHAWINPYRISSTTSDMENLSSDNPARKMYEKKRNDVYFNTQGIYYNPASERVQKLILDGIREIVNNYDIDGIHIDDFFYPTTDEEIDKIEFAEYHNNSGRYTLQEWRRSQVNAFVSGMYSVAKNKDENIIVSISPSANIEENKNTHFADVEKWCSESGFCDWIIPQVYYGLKNEHMPYKKMVDEWCNLVTKGKVKLVIGLSSYKCGEEDFYAGKGQNEWQTSDSILSEQLDYLRKKECDGFAMFSYNSLLLANETMKKEWANFSGKLAEESSDSPT